MQGKPADDTGTQGEHRAWRSQQHSCCHGKLPNLTHMEVHDAGLRVELVVWLGIENLDEENGGSRANHSRLEGMHVWLHQSTT